MEQINRRFFNVSIGLKQNEPAKILFQYLILTVCSVIAGWCILRTASLSELTEQAFKHFTHPFRQCDSFEEVLSEFLAFVCSDLLCAILLLLSAFSLLNYWCSDLILAFLGLRLGGAASSLLSLRGFGYYSERWMLFVTRLLITLCFVLCAYFLSRCSYEYREHLKFGKGSRSIKHTVALILPMLVLISVILIFNILYCGFIFLI